MQDNEAELCEIVVREFERELGVGRGSVLHPERDHSGPPVDLRVELDGRWFAIEHTLIEPFDNFIRFGRRFAALTDEIAAELNGRMPSPGTYRLHFPMDPTKDHPPRAHAALRADITQWVRKAAAELHAEEPERLGRDHLPRGFNGVRATEIGGITISLRRQVHWSEGGQHDGALWVYRVVGEDIEDLRRRRLGLALDKKWGKLKASAENGDETVLILEWSDIALTNHVVIAQALKSLLDERDFCPTHVVLANTTTEAQWVIFRPVIQDVSSSDLEYVDVGRVRPTGTGGQDQ